MQLGLLTDMQFSCPTGMTGSFARGVAVFILFYFICHYLIIRLFYNKLHELIKEIEINGEET